MRVVLQRVLNASVTIENRVYSAIGTGLLILLAIEDSDEEEDIRWLCSKILNLRIFDDEHGVMNISVLDLQGEVLVVSQFTLYASTKKGNRPSYIRAAKPEKSIPLYNKFIINLEGELKGRVRTGIFGADMQITLINSGPVTILMDSKSRE